jgi:hypothetical protein
LVAFANIGGGRNRGGGFDREICSVGGNTADASQMGVAQLAAVIPVFNHGRQIPLDLSLRGHARFRASRRRSMSFIAPRSNRHTPIGITLEV